MPLIDIESEVFAECGSWKNFIDLEESLSLDELIALYDKTVERQQRLMETVAAAFGAEIEKPATQSRQSNPQPAWAIDPTTGGEATPVYGEEEAAALPIGLGYSIINSE